MGKDSRTGKLSATTRGKVALLERVAKKLADDSLFTDMSEFYKAFSSPTRIKILSALAVSEMCVHDIAQALHLTASAVSHQLAMLKRMRLVKSRRDGKLLFYSLDDEHITAILAIAKEHIEET